MSQAPFVIFGWEWQLMAKATAVHLVMIKVFIFLKKTYNGLKTCCISSPAHPDLLPRSWSRSQLGLLLLLWLLSLLFMVVVVVVVVVMLLALLLMIPSHILI